MVSGRQYAPLNSKRLERYLPVNSFSISENANWPMKSKTKMDAMEANFGRQFQFPTRACTSVLVSYATFYSFLKSFLSKYTQNISLKDRKSLRISNIFLQSQTELQVIYSHENKLPN